MTENIELLTTEEAAVILRVKPHTLEKRRCTGGGPPWTIPFGRVVRYDAKKLREWLRQREQTSTSQPRRSTSDNGAEKEVTTV